MKKLAKAQMGKIIKKAVRNAAVIGGGFGAGAAAVKLTPRNSEKKEVSKNTPMETMERRRKSIQDNEEKSRNYQAKLKDIQAKAGAKYLSKFKKMGGATKTKSKK